MGFRMGIVGLPNVGKSTLFNALTKTAAAQAANFPFCTIEPNVGDVAVPDARLDKLAEIAKSKQIIPTRMTFVDIAGLVKGASKGEGLGNQFLANIREVDAIAHVLRCFEDGDVTHVEGRVDPVADAETIDTELMIADIESIEKRLQNIVRKVRGGDKEAVQQERLMKAALEALEAGQPARTVEVAEEDAKQWRMLQVGNGTLGKIPNSRYQWMALFPSSLWILIGKQYCWLYTALIFLHFHKTVVSGLNGVRTSLYQF